MLIQTIDAATMNFSIFLLSAMLTAVPLPFSFKEIYKVNVFIVSLLIALGLITGVGFYITTNSLRKVSLVIVTVIGNEASLYSLLWAWLLSHEPISMYVVSGATLLIAGIIVLSISPNQVQLA